METGIHRIFVLLVALLPMGAQFFAAILSNACGMSFIDYMDSAKSTGLEKWDLLASFLALFSAPMVPPLCLFCIYGLANNLGNFASSFPTKLSNLVTAGREKIKSMI